MQIGMKENAIESRKKNTMVMNVEYLSKSGEDVKRGALLKLILLFGLGLGLGISKTEAALIFCGYWYCVVGSEVWCVVKCGVRVMEGMEE
ncbi:predicted protein [Sclerotinia sclerotiorum 1980 UF-70]|uniref:Transmembrane protein n=1 Tax=Sclerotinia sclerotiorum (strain ATCC 18683 / 1980 / Ss-1) TaxID=665079 RepID=A7F4R8_SCLS1|nr:predicted protein [Sclerotinia sclerotiorum 1980 UF-70]EDN97739.1 predicted protein [Sclerotinia sclerotiorum 1980 UF-70]